jgi:hypothetical protein
MNLDYVLNVFEAACGSAGSNIVTIAQQQEAMKAIESFEGLDGFSMALIQIASANSLRPDCRLLAMVMLKNIVHKRWLSTRGGKLSPLAAEEKSAIKYFLSQSNSEEDKRILSQFSVLIAKVARHDWPGEWADLFPVLFNHLQSTESKTIRYNALISLLEVVSELSTKSLSFAKTSYSALCSQLFPLLSSMMQSQQMDLFKYLEALAQNNQGMLITFTMNDVLYCIDYLTTAYRLLMKLMEQCFYEIKAAEHLPQYFSNLAESLLCYLGFVRSMRHAMFQQNIKLADYSADDHVSAAAGSFSADFIKVILAVQQLIRIASMQPVNLLKQNPIDMVSYLETFLNFYIDQLFLECATSSDCKQRLDNSFAIAAATFLAESLSCKVYTAPTSHSDDSSSSQTGNVAKMASKLSRVGKSLDSDDSIAINTALTVKQQIFHENCVLQLLELCLTHLLRFSEDELRSWNEDPEHFYLTQESLSQSDTVKCSSEFLFLCLLDHNPMSVITRLVNLLMDSNRQWNCLSQSPLDFNEVEYWDAVYLCLGLGSSAIGKHIDAADWLGNSLGKIVNLSLSSPLHGCLTSGQQLLRYRLLWLLSCWMYYWDANIVSVIAQILVSIFDRSSFSDLVVKLSSLQTLESLLRSERFQSSFLLPSLERLIEALCYLVNEVEDSSTKSRIVGLFGEIALAMKRDLAMVIAPLVRYLGSIWEASDAANPLRRSILEALTVIVREARESALTLNAVVMPLIHFAITGAEPLRIAAINQESGDMNDEQASYLLGEGISLWLALSRNMVAHSDDADNLLVASLFTLFKDHGSAGDLEVESLKELLMIVEAHAIVGQLVCLQRCQDTLRLMYDKLFGQVAARVVPYLLRPLEAFALSCPLETSIFALQGGLLHRIVRSSCAYIPGLEDSMKSLLEPEIALVTYLSFAARIMLTDWNILTTAASNVMNELVLQGAAPAGLGSDLLLRSIAKLMIDMFDLVGGCAAGMWRRKMWCLALLSIYPSNDSTVLSWFEELLNMVDSVVCEEADDKSTNGNPNFSKQRDFTVELASSMVALSTEDAAFVGGELVEIDPIAMMMGALVMKDVVNQSSLVRIAQEKIQAVRKVIGDFAAGELIEKLPQETRNRLLSS